LHAEFTRTGDGVIDWLGAERGLAAAVLTFLMLWLLQPLARRWQLMDVPSGRKDHAHPTPIIGGLAMAIGIMVTGWSLLPSPGTPFLAFSLGSSLLILVGLLDDKHDLPWWLRICAQVTAALLMIYVGGVRVEHIGPLFGLGDTSLGFLAVPFTVFATVGVINAINMSDGADGMAGSLVLTAVVMLGAAAWYSGNDVMAQRVVILAGAVAAFLWSNMRFPWRARAHVFMGNAGSAFLGYAVVWIAFRLTQNPGHPVSPVLALWLLPVPVIDCLVVMTRRVRMGRSPFKADHNHIHHILRASGFQPMKKALVLSFFSAVCGLLVGQALRLDIPEPLLLGVFVALCGAWYWLTSRRERAVRFFATWGRSDVATRHAHPHHVRALPASANADDALAAERAA
jgi:UDP-GlcNAc:undecaprenyl-phosphate GlcNAc-1-phosphate transferase